MKQLLSLAAAFILAIALNAQQQGPNTSPAPRAPVELPNPPAVAAARGGPTPPPVCSQTPYNAPRPYPLVIPNDTNTQDGIFKVHHVSNCFYYEIPVSELGKDFLLEAKIARNTIGAGFAGRMVGTLVVRWERRDNRVFLRGMNYGITADPTSQIARAVDAANTPSILMAFNIEALGKGDAPVIEVSRMFNQEFPELSGRIAVRGRGMDPQRSFLERISSYPTNIEAESTQTFINPTEGAPTGGRGGLQQFGMQPGSGTVTMHFSMLKLPEAPMLPRVADARVGYYSESTMDFTRPEQRAERRAFIARWRLEKKDPAAEISEPVKPIVYYIDPATPKQWVPYIKKGIENWQPALEGAGFRNAILAREAPSTKDDPTWSSEDSRNSMVRWLPSANENVDSTHISDPRTGEIISADIQIHHNVINRVRDSYFVQVGPLDPRARSLPLPDDLMGELLAYVVTHEVGHTLGLEHNMKASSTYPVEKLRDPEWLRTMGFTPSVMDYARFNYVVQPEDKIDPKLLIASIGPYDKFAIHWGYAPIAGAKNADDERKTLEKWTREQDSTPWLRFSTEGNGAADPGENQEAVGDNDAVLATTLGLKNLSRVMDMLLPAATREGDDWTDLEQVYGDVLVQWLTELTHVSTLIGGVDSQDKHGGQSGVRFVAVPRARQKAAVKFLNENAFQTPAMFLKPEILRRIEPAGALARVRTAQLRVLSSVMSVQRFSRLVEQQALDGSQSYAPSEFLADLRDGIFGEMSQSRVKIDAYRRNLQRAYLELVASRLNGNNRAMDDQRPMLRGELQEIAANAKLAEPKAADRETRLHLEDLRAEIAKILDPKVQQASPAALGQPVPLSSIDGGSSYLVF